MKHSSAIIAITTLSVLFSSTTVNAFYAIGSCPKTYPKVNNPFGSTGDVANGQYYIHKGDDQWLDVVHDMLPDNMKPSAYRRFSDCSRKTIQKRAGGVEILQ